MKKLLFSVTVLCCTFFNLTAQNVNISDANFKAYLVGNVAINTNSDTEIQVSEANAFTGTINCSTLGITDLTGIEAFTNLTQLNCNTNNLASLDVSNNTALIQLRCNANVITNLDVSNNTALTLLSCNSNQLINLDLSQNTALQTLSCTNNQLTSLNVNNITTLKYLICGNNQITNLNVSTNTALEEIDCFNNQLTDLNVKNGNNSNFTFFNASNNPNLTCIEVDDAAYSTTNWTNIDAGASFNENCSGPCTVNIPDANFKTYLVGNSAINTNADTEIQCTEATAFTGAIVCNALNISDLTGIEAFVNITQLQCVDNLLTSLDVSNNTALTLLNCATNQLTALDVSNNTSLINLFCLSNQITSLDLSNNTVLLGLDCRENLLTTLDVSNNTALYTLYCSTNNLSVLDVSNNAVLANLYCNTNNLVVLDVSNNTALESLHCYNNQLTALNVKNGNNSNVVGILFNALNNPDLTCIEVDDVAYSTTNWTNIDATASFSENCSGPCTVNIPDANFKAYLVGNSAINTNADTEIQCTEATAFTGAIQVDGYSIYNLTGIEAFTSLTELDCRNNPLPSIDVSNNTALTELVCYNNYLTTLDLSNNISLTHLYCHNNLLTTLNTSNNTALTQLHCHYNQLTTLDLSNNTSLTLLFCRANNLSVLDVSNIPTFTQLDCRENQLTNLNVKNGNNSNFVGFNANNNPDLTCIQVDDAAYSTTNWTNIDATASFNEDCTLSTEVNDIEQTVFSFYPNPASTTLNVEVKDISIPINVQIINLLGKTVATQTLIIGNNKIDVSGLTSGVYFIHSDMGVTVKFIKE